MPSTRLADGAHPGLALRLAVICSLAGAGGIAAADDEPLPDIEFLEYLGSWEETDEDWVLLSEAAAAQVAQNNEEAEAATEEAAKAAKVETDDES